MSEELRTAVVEWAGWRFKLLGVESHSDFPPHDACHLEISGHIRSAERVAEFPNLSVEGDGDD